MPDNSQLLSLLPILLIAGLMFMMFRARKKQAAQQAALITSLTPGTKVLLGSGFFGTIMAIEGDRARVELAPGVETEVLSRAILRVDHDAAQVPGDDVIGKGDDPKPPSSPIEER